MRSEHRIPNFLQSGVIPGDNPHPLFDPDFYGAQVPGLDRSATVAHYIDHGASLGLSPHPLFDPAYYQQQAGPSPDPLGSYLDEGWLTGFDPHPLFSVDYYLAHAPDVAAAGVEPLTHYVTQGGGELRSHHPLFDPSYYLSQLSRLGSEAVVEPPLVHYLRTGGAVDPTPYFSSRWYLTRSEEARRSPLPPLVHWLIAGAGMGIPPSSRSLPEVVTDLLLSDNIIGALLALAYAHSDRRGFPHAKRALSYHFGDLPEREVAEGMLVGGLPGLVVGEQVVVGATPPERPTNLARVGLAAVVRPDRVLVSAAVHRAEEPMRGILVPELGFDSDEVDWLLTVVPSLWERRARSSELTLVLPMTPLPFVLEAVRHLAGWENVTSLDDGELREFGRATIARAESGSLARFRDALWGDRPQRGRRIVLVTHPDDPFDAKAVSRLRRTVLEVGGVPVDVEWGAQALLSALESADSIFAAESLAHVALLAAPGTRIVSMGRRGAKVMEKAEGTGVVVDHLQLDPIPDPRSQDDSALVEVSAALEHIESSAAR